MSGENNSGENNKDKREESEGRGDAKRESPLVKGGVPVWIWVIIFILIIVCLYFLSLINSKRFMLVEENGYLVIKKGLLLPYGYSEYMPQDVVKRETYLPIKIPDGERITPQEIEKDELDIAIFRIVSNWVEKLLKDESEENVNQASTYIERLMRLNVSPDDFERYSRLKGELWFRQARFSFNMGLDMIRQSRQKIEDIGDISPEFKKEAEQLLLEIQNIENSLNPEYVLVKNEDIMKIREEIKRECIDSCVKATLEHPMEEHQPATEEESSAPPPQPERSQ